jgi:hypothetical protein
MQIIAFVQTDKIGSRVEATIDLDDEELAGLDDAARARYISDYVWDEITNTGMVEWGWDKS